MGEGRGRAERLVVVKIVKDKSKLKPKTVSENICINMNFCRLKVGKVHRILFATKFSEM